MSEETEKMIMDWLARIETKLDAVHRPSDCPLNERIRKVELTEARQKGIITIVGAIAGIIAGAFLNLIANMFKR